MFLYFDFIIIVKFSNVSINSILTFLGGTVYPFPKS